MLLIMAFAVYVIITKRLRITRSITLLGSDARDFGITLLVLALPIAIVAGIIVRTIIAVSPALAVFPWPRLLAVTLNGVAIVTLAFAFRGKPTTEERVTAPTPSPQPIEPADAEPNGAAKTGRT